MKSNMKAPVVLVLLLWAAFAVALWIFTLIYLAFNIEANKGPDSQAEKLSFALSTVRDLQIRNAQLKDLVESERQDHALALRNEQGTKNRLLAQIKLLQEDEKNNVSYTKEHEVARRRLNNNIWELYYYLHNELKSQQIPNTETLRFHTENQLLSLLGSSVNLETVDSYDKKRKLELQNLTEKIQSKIHKMQNPESCNETRVLICNLYKNCGFGCQIHHLAYCLLVAFGEERMMIMQNDGKRWNYSSVWSSSFAPLSKCSYNETTLGNPGEFYFPGLGARILNINVVEGLGERPEHLPLSFPKLYADQLERLHSNPPAYFMSQFVWYVMRNNDAMNDAVDKAAVNIPFGRTPVVGIHVRRTDKIGFEAKFHYLEEYIEWVDIWFKIQERIQGKVLNRTVFIASDDPNIIQEAKEKYPTYHIYGNVSIAESAAKDKRHLRSSIEGTIIDARLLSRCDYLVCTFSSQICRMSYELMQVLQNDDGQNFHSLDDLYYYGGQFEHEQIAVEDHTPENKEEIELKVGDTIGIAGNHWNGFSKGVNRRTEKSGMYPSYKTKEKWRLVDFPILI